MDIRLSLSDIALGQVGPSGGTGLEPDGRVGNTCAPLAS